MPTTEPAEDIARVVARITHVLLAAETADETLQRIVELAAETVEGCDNCGVSIVQLGGDITTPAATSESVAKCDELQYAFGEGPCVSAIWEQQTFESDDLTQERRWPKWAPRAVELGANSLVSFRLFVKEDTLGALNLYAGKPGAFDDVDRAVGAILASHGAMALSGARRQARLEGAVVVAKATGMLMERRGITSAQALELLQRAAIRTDTKLQVVAERFVGRHHPHDVAADRQGQGSRRPR